MFSYLFVSARSGLQLSGPSFSHRLSDDATEFITVTSAAGVGSLVGL